MRLRTDVNDSIEVHDNEVNPRGGNSCTSPHNIISTQMHALSSSVQLLILCICYSLYFKFQTSLGLATTQCCRFFTCCLHRFAVFLSLLYQPAFYSMHRVGLRNFVEQTTTSQTRGGAHLSEMIQGYEQKGGAYPRLQRPLTLLLIRVRQ